MKVRVDSKEFSKAVRSASRYVKTTGLQVSEGILLKVADGSLMIRTTTGSEDCRVYVNAFDTEDGIAITLASVLIPSSIDSGGFVDISTDGNRLLLEYDNANFKLGTMDSREDDYPVWTDIDPIVGLDSGILRTACATTTPFDQTGHSIKSSIHIMQQEGVVVFGTDGYVGFIANVDGQVDGVVSIDSQMLIKSLSVVGETVTIGAQSGRIAVSGPIGDVTFSSTICKSLDDILAGFSLKTDYGPIEIDINELRRIALLCDSAARVHLGSEIQISGNNVWILGYNVDIRTGIGGEFPEERSIFNCAAFSRCIKSITSDKVTVSIKMLPSGTSQFWYIDGLGRYFVYSSAPVLLPSDETETKE